MTGPSDRELQELVDGERSRRAAEERRARGWLASSAAETSTMAQLLVGLAERSAEVVVHVAGGSWCRGRATAVGADHLVVVTGGGRTLVALDAITSVHPGPDGGPHPAGGRPAEARRGLLADALRDAAVQRDRVQLHLRDGRLLEGVIGGCGTDLATLVPAGGSTVHIALGALAMVVRG